jgi:hypothetical protein
MVRKEIPMKPSKTRFSILFAFIVLAVPSQLLAQSETGTITGTIADASGAVVPGVAITLTSPALIGGPRTVTSELGTYRFIALPPGTYDLKFELPGLPDHQPGRYPDHRQLRGPGGHHHVDAGAGRDREGQR